MFAVVLISANAEWRVVREVLPGVEISTSPYGEWFVTELAGRSLVFLHGGWGKVAAAASTQYAIGRWSPRYLINLGTCGGFEGAIQRGAVVLPDKTIIYDIIEQMEPDPSLAIGHYTVDLDLSWLIAPYPMPVWRGPLVSADRDLSPNDIPTLAQTYGACAADWESGAIAWVANRAGVRCLILRGVSDLVGENGGEAYCAPEVFQNGTRQVMQLLLNTLPAWLCCID
jgi:adenosylhomocysteine nucleosidase